MKTIIEVLKKLADNPNYQPTPEEVALMRYAD